MEVAFCIESVFEAENTPILKNLKEWRLTCYNVLKVIISCFPTTRLQKLRFFMFGDVFGRFGGDLGRLFGRLLRHVWEAFWRSLKGFI